MKGYSISVVVPNFNGRLLLEKNLPYLFEALHTSNLIHEIIIVDDASSDDSVDFIKNNYPNIRCLVHEFNKGFSSACNTGIFSAQNQLIFLLNTDIILPTHFFDTQLTFFNRPDTFGVMSGIVGPDGKTQDVARYAKWNGGKIKANNFYYPDRSAQPPYTIYLSGANALINREKLLQLKGFNEVLNPFYCEDLDLGLRAWRMGWRCYYDANAQCIHDEATTTRKFNSRFRVKSIHLCNRLLVHQMHLKGKRKALWMMQIFVELLFSWLILRLHIYKAFYRFILKKKEADLSAQQFEHLLSQQNELSINEVIAFFTSALKNLIADKERSK